MLPRNRPLTICWPTWAPPAERLLHHLELAALDPLDGRGVVPVPAGQEGELAERGGEAIHLGEAGLDVVATALHARLLDGLGDRQHPGVGLGAELVGIVSL